MAILTILTNKQTTTLRAAVEVLPGSVVDHYRIRLVTACHSLDIDLHAGEAVEVTTALETLLEQEGVAV